MGRRGRKRRGKEGKEKGEEIGEGGEEGVKNLQKPGISNSILKIINLGTLTVCSCHGGHLPLVVVRGAHIVSDLGPGLAQVLGNIQL